MPDLILEETRAERRYHKSKSKQLFCALLMVASVTRPDKPASTACRPFHLNLSTKLGADRLLVVLVDLFSSQKRVSRIDSDSQS
jgi:hypothetical protein